VQLKKTKKTFKSARI